MKNSPFTINAFGQKVWMHQEGDKYIVTGKLYRSTRNFPPMVYSHWPTARMINLWNGSRWLYRDGKRYLIERVYN